MTRKKMKKSSETSPTAPTSLSSLPDDIIVNCLARISRFHYPTLSLVSKCFRSLLASPELEATRSFIGITENYLCVCLNLYNNNYNPRWFTLSPIPKQRLKPVPWLWHRHQYPKSSTVVSNGSEIYIVGGLVSETGSKRVLVFDCRSHQWRSLPDMRQPRVSTAVDVVDSKLYVTGGYEPDNIEDWGEVYDPKTQTWEPILPTALDLTIQKSVVPGCLVMGGKLYTTNGWKMNICYVEIENLLLGQTSDYNRDLIWRDPKEDGFKWTRVKGLKQVLWKNITYVGNSPGGRRVTVWWTSVVKMSRHYWTEEFKTELWCAEISFERRRSTELWGFVEWSKNVFTFKGCDSPSNLVLDYAIVTY